MADTARSTDPLHFQGTTCDGCGDLHPRNALDQDCWCDACRPRMQRRMRIGRHGIAAVVTLPFAVWVWRLEKLEYLPTLAWLLPLAAAYYLGFRIGREVVRGYIRWRRVGGE